MKILYFILFAIIALIGTAANSQQPAPAAWEEKAQAYLQDQSYQFKSAVDGVYTAVNEKNRLGFIIGPEGYTIKKILNNPDAKDIFVRFQVNGNCNATASVEHNQLIYHQGKVDVQYIHDTNGLRQNFILLEKNDSSRASVSLTIQSSLEYHLDKNQSLVFSDRSSGSEMMRYDGLMAWDARHRTLPAHMELKGNVLTLRVNDENAEYPITIDPLSHATEWVTSSDGILTSLLTNLSLQIDALYGYSSAGLGDINNDGYDDVAIGAPGAVNILGGNTFVQAGAVFVYYGSSSGLPAAPSKILRGTTPIAGALFGLSIAAGDVAGGSTNDIIVGAPLDSYSTLAATAIVGTSTATVSSGKVYLFRSEDMSAGTPSPFLEIKLEGSDFFSKGILSLLLSNVSNKNLYGYSVAVSGDLNNDGKGEVIVGVPGYLGVGLSDVRSGAAFVHYSNNLAAPVKISAPSSNLLGIPTLPTINTDGLLFGFSVDGAGDFNGDGNNDIVVGAPAGLNLNLLGGIFTGKFLGGSAFVYYGTSSGGVKTGIDVTSPSRLEPVAGGLLTNALNLFGYSVKGVTNTSGQRNGRILIGAPNGNLLSNVLGGLRLRTGNVYVFKNNSGSTIHPDQTLASPRGTSLLSVLNGSNSSVSALFGASMDNLLDINCDGISDIVVGEPLSTGVGLIGADVLGGAAIVFTGKADGTYNTTPYSTLTTVVSMDLGINAASMLGFSVAGGRHIYGSAFAPRIVVGAPGKALDFGSGLLNLGNTLGTLLSFTGGNNGLGKAYTMSLGSCSILPVNILSFDVAKKEAQSELTWKTSADVNIGYFEVMHSTDGVTYNVLGKVAYSESKTHTFKWLHATPAPGTNYYRIRFVDKDGSAVISRIQSLQFGSSLNANVQVVPNPVYGSLVNVKFDGMLPGTYGVGLLTSTGIVVRSEQVEVRDQSAYIAISRNGLPAGSYFVRVSDLRGSKVSVVKVMLR